MAVKGAEAWRKQALLRGRGGDWAAAPAARDRAR